MKKLNLLFLSLFIIGLTSSPYLLGANPGDFRSAGSGNWGDLSTWQTWDGSSWVGAGTTPDSNITTAVTILSPNNVTVAATVAVRNVTVDAGATVTVNGTPVVLYITNEGMTVNGTLTIVGDVAAATPFSVMKTTGTLTIGSTGVVNYNQYTAASANKGALPIATWSTGSTLNVNATGGATCSNFQGAGSAQNFYNINWNVPSTLASNFGFGLVGCTIGGTINIMSTGTGRFYFFGGTGGTVRVNGDFIVTGSCNVSTGGSSSVNYDTVIFNGKVNVNTTGVFAVSRGTQGNAGTSTMIFQCDSVKILAGTMQNSDTGNSVGKFVFKKSGAQYVNITPAAVTGNGLPIQVDAGSTVYLTAKLNVTTLYLNGGIIVSSTSNPLVMGWWNGSTVSGGTISPSAPGSSTSFVSGPMAYMYATAGGTTSKVYPIGKDGIYRPLTLSLTQTAATQSTYTAEMFNAAPPLNTLPGTLNNVAPGRYYTISEGAGGSAFTVGQVKLSYDAVDGVVDSTALKIAQGPVSGGGTWTDLGGNGHGIPAGTISSSMDFTSLANTVFVLANLKCDLNLTAVLEAMWVAGGGTTMTMTPDVTVELHDASTFALVAFQTSTLSTAGVGTLRFNTIVSGTPYYLVVKSPNTVEAWSADAHSFTAGLLTYDFTTGVDKAFTDGSNPSLVIHSGKYCIYSGDVNQDGFVTGDDFQGVDNDAANFDYHIANDVNGDGFVTGDDFQFIDNNAALFVQRQVPPGAPSHLVKHAVKGNVQHKSSVK